VGGGEAEDVSDLFARIELGVLSKLNRVEALGLGSFKGRWVPMDHSKSKKHEGVAVYLAIASNTLKKIRIVVFEHFTHQLVIVLIEELVTVCIRSRFDPQSHLKSFNKPLVRTSGPSPSIPTKRASSGVRESKPMISAKAPIIRAMSRGVSPFLSRVMRASRL